MNEVHATCSDINQNLRILTVPELAKYLGIGKNRAYALLNDGIIKGFRIGSTWRVSLKAVNQYILNQSNIDEVM